MTEQRWHDADTRPSYGGAPGPYPGPPDPDPDPRPPQRDPGARRATRTWQPPPSRTSRWWGALTGRAGICIVIGSAALGSAITAAAGSEPGLVLGVCLIAGTVAAALAVRPAAGYLIIPVPALAYVAAATVAGLIHDRATDTSRTALAIGAAQWIASGFIAITAATILAIAMTAARWRASRRGPRGPG